MAGPETVTLTIRVDSSEALIELDRLITKLREVEAMYRLIQDAATDAAEAAKEGD